MRNRDFFLLCDVVLQIKKHALILRTVRLLRRRFHIIGRNALDPFVRSFADREDAICAVDDHIRPQRAFVFFAEPSHRHIVAVLRSFVRCW